MTALEPAFLEDPAQISGLELRQAFLGLQEGVMDAGDLKVTTGAGLSVDVAAGRALVQGDAVTDQGLYACLVPETKILYKDLIYREIGGVQVGDQLVGIDEHSPGEGLHRRLRVATVTRVGRREAVSYRLVFADGREIVASEEHPWLVNRQGRYQWIETSALGLGNQLYQLGLPWEPDESRGAGYLAGVFDGEGCLGPRGYAVTFSQVDNECLATATAVLEEKGFEFAAYLKERNGQPAGRHWQSITRVELRGMANVMRFFGQIRPHRLLPKFAEAWPDRSPTVTKHGQGSNGAQAELVAIEPVGTREVVSITTDTATFVAEGLFTHNCRNDATVNSASAAAGAFEAGGIPAAHATLPTVHRIVWRVYDATHEGSLRKARPEVIAGTPTSGATLDNMLGAAAVPGGACLLADGLVAAAAGSIPAGNIRDRRKWARGAFSSLIGNNAGSLTTTSSTFVAQSLAQRRIECSGVPLRVGFTGTVRNQTAGAFALLMAMVDGAVAIASSQLVIHSVAASEEDTVGAEFTFTPAAGSHLVSMGLAQAGGGTAEVLNSSANRFFMTFEEVVRQDAHNG